MDGKGLIFPFIRKVLTKNLKIVGIFIAKCFKITSNWIISLIEWVMEDILFTRILQHHIDFKINVLALYSGKWQKMTIFVKAGKWEGVNFFRLILMTWNPVIQIWLNDIFIYFEKPASTCQMTNWQTNISSLCSPVLENSLEQCTAALARRRSVWNLFSI